MIVVILINAIKQKLLHSHGKLHVFCQKCNHLEVFDLMHV